jgi:hypothetical protein
MASPKLLFGGKLSEKSFNHAFKYEGEIKLAEVADLLKKIK